MSMLYILPTKCNACSEHGEVGCTNCAYSGECPAMGEWVICNQCKGHGSLPCENCHGLGVSTNWTKREEYAYMVDEYFGYTR